MTDVGSRISPDFLRRYLASPSTAHPGTTMPDVLVSRPEAERDRIAEALTHFLVAQSKTVFQPEAVEQADRLQGQALFHSVGCVACHGPKEAIADALQKPKRNDEEDDDEDKALAAKKAIKPLAVKLGHVAAKYSVKSLSEFLFQPLRVRSSGRMPDMKLTPAESLAIAGYLVGEQPQPGKALVPDSSLAALGKQHFQELNCAACHALPGITAAPQIGSLRSANLSRGCLSRTNGRSPRFQLEDAQITAIVAALREEPSADSDKLVVAKTLTAFHCIACHVRDDYGGVHDAHNPFFVGSELKLGDDGRIPPHANVVDVTQPPYSAKGDGVSNCTDALQAALNENVGRHRVLFFPKGTYLVSRTLTWPKQFGGHEKWGFTMLRGADRDATTLRLKDATFTDAKKPKALMWCGGFGSADWFHNYIENLTFDVGTGNPGATALQFYSNNTGAVRDCRFVAPEGSGAVGLDLSHRDMNGPLLVSRCEVTGFRTGVTTGHSVNSQTFEFLTLRGQRELGFRNEGQQISIRGLTSDNTVPALGTYGRLLLADSTLTGRYGATKHPAIVNYNGGLIFLRDVKTSGYARALADMKTPDFAAAWRIQGEDKPGSLGPDIREYSSHAAKTLFPSPAASLRLPVKETPRFAWEPPATWAVVDAFGADPSGKQDSTQAIQRAMNSGATTIFFPGSYKCAATIAVRGKVRAIVGLGGSLNYGQCDLLNFRIEDGDAPTVEIRHFGHLGGGIEIATRRTVVLRSIETHTLSGTAAAEGGEVFLEDVAGNNFRFRKQRVWARQLNIENEGTHLTNDGGDVWVLGYKTERGGTLAHTRGGGRTEILGGFSYTTTAGKLAPMFINEESSLWTWFGEICYNGDPFAVRVRETRGGETRTMPHEDGGTIPYSGRKP